MNRVERGETGPLNMKQAEQQKTWAQSATGAMGSLNPLDGSGKEQKK